MVGLLPEVHGLLVFGVGLEQKNVNNGKLVHKSLSLEFLSPTSRCARMLNGMTPVLITFFISGEKHRMPIKGQGIGQRSSNACSED